MPRPQMIGKPKWKWVLIIFWKRRSLEFSGFSSEKNTSFSPNENTGTRLVPVSSAKRMKPLRFFSTSLNLPGLASSDSAAPPTIKTQTCPLGLQWPWFPRMYLILAALAAHVPLMSRSSLINGPKNCSIFGSVVDYTSQYLYIFSKLSTF